MYKTRTKAISKSVGSEGGNAILYSNSKSMNPYAQDKEDCRGRLVSKRLVAKGEEFLFMGDPMTSREDVRYALNYPYGTMNSSLNRIVNHAGKKGEAGTDEIERVDVKVYETDFTDEMKKIYIDNIIKLMQFKGIAFSQDLRIDFEFVKLANTLEMDGEGKLVMDFKYVTCKE